jgi:arginine repressor
LTGQNSDTGNTPSRNTANQSASLVTQSTETRQERKAGLVRMPRPAGSAIYEAPEEDAQGEQSPQEAFRALKAARGQPT